MHFELTKTELRGPINEFCLNDAPMTHHGRKGLKVIKIGENWRYCNGKKTAEMEGTIQKNIAFITTKYSRGRVE